MGIALCFVPLIFALVLTTAVYKIKITHQLIATLLGLIAVFPISVIQYFLPEIPGLGFSLILYSLIKSLLLYGLVEELFKMLLIIPLPHKNYSPRDFLLLAFIMGLSLGCFESVVYYFDHLQLANYRGATLLYGQIAIRIFTSDIIHMSCMGLSGLFIYSCRNKMRHISFFVISVILHGIYDFFAGFSNNLRWFSIAVVFMALIECRIKYTTLTNQEG
ncbi:MAG: PrsW family intramembrane metalloprotease [Treponema sp.]|nr:PrsW family intramembrane metalloprotease [Treponema sp.]